MTFASDTQDTVAISSTRNASLDIAKGIAIVLVVLGHAIDGVQAAGQETYATRLMLTMLYTSHVPLFFLIAGMLSGGMTRQPWVAFFAKLWQRVVWPYLLWSFVILTLLYVLGDLTNTRQQTYQPLSILWHAPAVMWFLYTLAIGMVLLRIVANASSCVALTLALILLLGPYMWEVWPPKCRFIGLMLIGAWVGPIALRFALLPPVAWIAGIVMGLTLWYASGAAVFPSIGYPAQEFAYVPAMFAGPVLILALSHGLAKAGGGRLPDRLGQNTLAIFVSHILCTAGTRILLMGAGVTDGWVLIICATVAGVSLPLLAAEFARARRLSKYLGWA